MLRAELIVAQGELTELKEEVELLEAEIDIFRGKPSKNERRKRMGISELRLLLQLPKDLRNQIRAEAKRRYLSLNGIIRLAVSEWLEEQRIIKQLEQGAVKRKTKVKLSGEARQARTSFREDIKLDERKGY